MTPAHAIAPIPRPDTARTGTLGEARALGTDVRSDIARLEEAPPGPELARALAAAGTAGPDGDGLLNVIGAWHRLGAWAKAGELAAINAFLTERTRGRPGNEPFESAAAEIQLELTLTGYGTDRLLELAVPLADRLPQTLHALRTGMIDEAKARIIAHAVPGTLDAPAAAALERCVLPDAPTQTTGQLRAAVQRALITLDPAAADRRRVNAEAGRRVELRATDTHTADLCGRDLPADQAIAADNRITAIATALKRDGTPGTLAFLRAQVFTTLLLGTGTLPTWPPGTGGDLAAADIADPAPRPRSDAQKLDRAGHAGPAQPGSLDRAGGSGPPQVDDRVSRPHGPDGVEEGDAATPFEPRITGTVNVIVPIETLYGRAERPGEVPGFGPVLATTARAIAVRTSRRAWWRYTLVDPAGRAVAYGRVRAPDDTVGYEDFLSRIAGNLRKCEHGISTEAYRPGESLRKGVRIRDRTCRFPGCRRPAESCDLDHTVPYADGGPTCICNLAALCRKHHRIKGSGEWRLAQPTPGELTWITPAERRYRVIPDTYPRVADT